MPSIEIDVSERISRHLAAVRLMSHMIYPDDAQLRGASEITFRTILAGWYSGTLAKQGREAQVRLIRQIGPKLGADLPRALADPAGWMMKRIFDKFLSPAGGIQGAALQLTTSPSAEELEREWSRRWWPVVYTGKLLALIGSIHQHHREVGASVNKAIHVLCQTEGSEHVPGFPGVYESSLKKAWAKFRPGAHLCAAYVTTETHYYKGQISHDFWEYWKEPPAFCDDRLFQVFCRLAKSAETFATSFFPRGRQQPLIPNEEIFALPDGIFEPGLPLPPFRALTEEEAVALKGKNILDRPIMGCYPLSHGIGKYTSRSGYLLSRLRKLPQVHGPASLAGWRG
jgi:hypothetical protein